MGACIGVVSGLRCGKVVLLLVFDRVCLSVMVLIVLFSLFLMLFDFYCD